MHNGSSNQSERMQVNLHVTRIQTSLSVTESFCQPLFFQFVKYVCLLRGVLLDCFITILL